MINIINDNDPSNIYIMCDRKDGDIINELNIWSIQMFFFSDNIIMQNENVKLITLTNGGYL